MRPRRVVTGHDVEGKATIVSDGAVPRHVVRTAIPGMEDSVVWATAVPLSAAADGADPTAAVSSVVPGPGESRFLTVTLPPAAVFAAADFDAAAAAAEDAVVVPGLAERFDADDPGMHSTPTVDYAVVLSGEIALVMEDGSEALLGPGDLVVQNATRHAWRNRGDDPATLATVLIGVSTNDEGDRR